MRRRSCRIHPSMAAPPLLKSFYSCLPLILSFPGFFITYRSKFSLLTFCFSYLPVSIFLLSCCFPVLISLLSSCFPVLISFHSSPLLYPSFLCFPHLRIVYPILSPPLCIPFFYLSPHTHTPSSAESSLQNIIILKSSKMVQYCTAPPMVCSFLSTTAQLHATHRKGGRRRKRHSTSTREWGHSCLARGYCVS